MKVLLSIKPEFAEKIFNGEKKYEFRKSIFRHEEVNRVIVYVTEPVAKVIGEFEIDKVISDNISSLWAKTKEHAGITEDLFFKYFSSCEIGHAIKVKNYTVYETPYDIQTMFGIKPPQSFVYVKK